MEALPSWCGPGCADAQRQVRERGGRALNPRWRDTWWTPRCSQVTHRPLLPFSAKKRMGVLSVHINTAGLRRPGDRLQQHGGGGVRAGRSRGDTLRESGRAKEEQLTSKEAGTSWAPGTISHVNALASSPSRPYKVGPIILPFPNRETKPRVMESPARCQSASEQCEPGLH